jgi:DNA invertase Pin-like site-specific DNA recombinase
MGNNQNVAPKKVVRLMEPAVILKGEQVKAKYRRTRVVAYCRVSTKEEEQLNSYENQLNYYTGKINEEPEWEFVGIFADKGITGTSVKKRDEFNKMIRLCKRGKVDMIITKSISRFARNTVDCLKYTRMLKDLGVDVFFEEQNLHSTQPGAELYITIYGCMAQNESENISANVIWGKLQSAKEGKVSFVYSQILGYRKGDDGSPEIDEEQAVIVRRIYDSFLAGEGMNTIAEKLSQEGIPTVRGGKWGKSTIYSILTNERYKGDAIINKTFVVDCLTKKVKKNNGERPKYYVENNHPAIIDPVVFARVQEEVARRSPKRQEYRKGQGEIKMRYSAKYALTQVLVCGECKTPYRRYTWVKNGEKKGVWRCECRAKFKKKYCKHSPALEERYLHETIMNGVMSVAQENTNLLTVLKQHIGQVIGNPIVDNSLEIQVRINEIDKEFKALIDSVTADMVDGFDQNKVEELMREKQELQKKLQGIKAMKERENVAHGRLSDIYTVMDGLKNHPLMYNDTIVRNLIECIVVESKESILLIFKNGLERRESLVDKKTLYGA